MLKPPGGGHSNIFGEPDVCPNKPRPKYDQQNSSNLSCVMGTVDANLKVQDVVVAAAPAPAVTEAAPKPVHINNVTPAVNNGAGAESRQAASAPQSTDAGGKVRVPPGGFSSGLW